MVAAVHYYATAEDHAALLDYLGEPYTVMLHPWPVVDSPARALTRAEALAADQVMVVHRELGQPSLIRLVHPALAEPTKAGVFNQLNWARLRPTGGQGLVDSNTSPVLLWAPAKASDAGLRTGDIGSQADAMDTVSSDYQRWVNRVMGWVRRKGTKVWGLEGAQSGSGLDIHLHTSTPSMPCLERFWPFATFSGTLTTCRNQRLKPQPNRSRSARPRADLPRCVSFCERSIPICEASGPCR